MSGVRDVLRGPKIVPHCEIVGFLVLIDDQVCLVDLDLDEPWQKTPMVRVEPKGLQYALMLQLAQMGGGNSLFFHEAIISGELRDGEIFPSSLLAKDSKKAPWKEIDFTSSSIAKGRARFGHLENPPTDVADFWDVGG